MFDQGTFIFARVLLELLHGSLICYTHCSSGPILDFLRTPSIAWSVCCGKGSGISILLATSTTCPGIPVAIEIADMEENGDAALETSQGCDIAHKERLIVTARNCLFLALE